MSKTQKIQGNQVMERIITVDDTMDLLLVAEILMWKNILPQILLSYSISCLFRYKLYACLCKVLDMTPGWTSFSTDN